MLCSKEQFRPFLRQLFGNLPCLFMHFLEMFMLTHEFLTVFFVKWAKVRTSFFAKNFTLCPKFWHGMVKLAGCHT